MFILEHKQKISLKSWIFQNLYKSFSCSAFKTIVFLLKFKNNNAFLTASFKSAMILECETNSEATDLYHSQAIVPLTNQKSCLLVDGIQMLSWARPSLPAGGFSLPFPPPSFDFCARPLVPGSARLKNPRWHLISEQNGFSTMKPPVTACKQARNMEGANGLWP